MAERRPEEVVWGCNDDDEEEEEEGEGCEGCELERSEVPDFCPLNIWEEPGTVTCSVCIYM